MTAEAIPVQVLRAIPLIHTLVANWDCGRPAVAYTCTLGRNSNHSGDHHVSGWDQASAWEAMCTKLAHLPLPGIPLWEGTRQRLFLRYMGAQSVLASLFHARQRLGETLTCIMIKRDGEAARSLVLEALSNPLRHGPPLLSSREPATNGAACRAAVADMVRHAAKMTVHGANDARRLEALDDEVMASEEKAIFKGGSVRAMMMALRLRLELEVTTSLTTLGQWSLAAEEGPLSVHLDAADLADADAFADRMVDYWSDLKPALLRSVEGLLTLQDAKTLTEVV